MAKLEIGLIYRLDKLCKPKLGTTHTTQEENKKAMLLCLYIIQQTGCRISEAASVINDSSGQVWPTNSGNWEAKYVLRTDSQVAVKTEQGKG